MSSSSAISSTDSIYSKILGTGGYLPEKVLTNNDLETMVETTDQWITDRTGIKKRHIAAEGETTCDLAEKAARQAMDAAGVSGVILTLLLSPPPHLIGFSPALPACYSTAWIFMAARRLIYRPCVPVSCMHWVSPINLLKVAAIVTR